MESIMVPTWILQHAAVSKSWISGWANISLFKEIDDCRTKSLCIHLVAAGHIPLTIIRKNIRSLSVYGSHIYFMIANHQKIKYPWQNPYLHISPHISIYLHTPEVFFCSMSGQIQQDEGQVRFDLIHSLHDPIQVGAHHLSRDWAAQRSPDDAWHALVAGCWVNVADTV